MTKLQEEKVRWIEKYNKLAEEINMPEYRWGSGNLETVKKRYAKLYVHYTETKHIDKPVDWIIQEEEKEEIKTTFKMIKDEEWDEYQIQVFENGILNEKRTYFTDDREDAYGTMKAMKGEVK